MRVLFASTAGAGHFNPLIPWIDLLSKRGHDVLVVGPPNLARQAESRGYAFRAGAVPDPGQDAPVMQRITTMRHEDAGPLMVGEVFTRLNSGALLPAMRQAIAQWQPDVVLRDPTEFASAVVAAAAGIPHCRIGHGLAAGESTIIDYASAVLEELHKGSTQAIIASPYVTLFPEELDPSLFPLTIRYREQPDRAAPRQPLPDWWGGSVERSST